MKCPYCDGEMQHGKLSGDGRSRVHFAQEGKKVSWSENLVGVGIVQTKRRFGKFEIDGDYCEKCKKIILDAEVGK
ncbi:MAG: hypothetical protein E7316_01115 [Clostridiales bacterium]|nr:hypothetical protein [Clostridiales bacterium]